jgi:hypothetical protein
MAPHPSVKDFLDNRRRTSLPDADDITCATTAENGDVLLTIRVKTKEDEEIDTSEFEFDQLDKLRAQDPFLYYSIQNDLRRNASQAKVVGASGGESVIANSFNTSNEPAARRTSMPNLAIPNSNPRQARRHSTIATTNMVKRQRRLSTETHPSLMYESFLAGFDGDTDSDGPQIVLDDVEEEELLSILCDD